MKTVLYFLPAVLAIMTLSGCANDGNEPSVSSQKQAPEFSATIGGQSSRAFNSFWESGDLIGISGANGSNVSYVTNDGTGKFEVKTPGQQIYFQDEDEVTFSAYYPWCDLNGTTSINVDTHDQTEQKSFDFLWASATGKKDAPSVKFMFGHKMTKVSISVRPGNDVSYDELKAATLSLGGFRHNGTFMIDDGAAVASGDVCELWKFSDFAQYNDVDKTLSFSFIFFPQELANPLDFIAELTLADNKSYHIRATINFAAANGAGAKNEWIAGCQYSLSLTLHKTEIVVEKNTITEWDLRNLGNFDVL